MKIALSSSSLTPALNQQMEELQKDAKSRLTDRSKGYKRTEELMRIERMDKHVKVRSFVGAKAHAYLPAYLPYRPTYPTYLS